MGYCNPIPANAQQDLDIKTGQRIMKMRARGEKIRTLHDMFEEHGRPK